MTNPLYDIVLSPPAQAHYQRPCAAGQEFTVARGDIHRKSSQATDNRRKLSHRFGRPRGLGIHRDDAGTARPEFGSFRTLSRGDRGSHWLEADASAARAARNATRDRGRIGVDTCKQLVITCVYCICKYTTAFVQGQVKCNENALK